MSSDHSFLRKSFAVISNAHCYPFRQLSDFVAGIITIRVPVQISERFLNQVENRRFDFWRKEGKAAEFWVTSLAVVCRDS
jgi:hypothetical protein